MEAKHPPVIETAEHPPPSSVMRGAFEALLALMLMRPPSMEIVLPEPPMTGAPALAPDQAISDPGLFASLLMISEPPAVRPMAGRW